MRAMFRPKIKLDVFFPPENMQMNAGRCAVPPSSEAHLELFGGEKKSQNKNFEAPFN
jgi:hypothetical protein